MAVNLLSYRDSSSSLFLDRLIPVELDHPLSYAPKL